MRFFRRADPFFTKPLIHIAKWLHTGLVHTLKVSIEGEEHLATEGPLIIAFWHNQIALAPILRRLMPNRPLRLVISNSRDGRKLATFAKLYSDVAVTFVPHNKRREALAEMVAVLQEQKEVLLITPDGPRGPLYQVKPGVIYSAKETGARVIAMRWKVDRFWQFQSWDKMRLPKPFSRVSLCFEPPFSCPQHVPTHHQQAQLAKLLGL